MLKHRAAASSLLRGEGLEIGALHEPFAVSGECRVRYFDAIDPHRAAELFPEIPAQALVPVDHLGDLDHDGLASFPGGRLDFVVINHVLEHVANPLFIILEVFRILRPGGRAVIAVPDMRFTFDAGRVLTGWDHLWEDYLAGRTASSDDHYLDFLRSAAPHVFREPPENLSHHLERARRRREHAHVWTSQTFKDHLERTLDAASIPATLLFESTGDSNRFEYFSVWEKTTPTMHQRAAGPSR